MGETDSGTSYTVTVLFFSVLKEETGTAKETLTLSAPARGTDLLEVVTAKYPELDEYRSSIRLAVNQEYVPHDVELGEGDEVALITPVSGG